MKYLRVCVAIAFSLVASGSYLYGVRVGGERLAAHRMAICAFDSLSDVEDLKHNPNPAPLDLYEFGINDALISYGKYLERRKPLAPGLNSIEGTTRLMIRRRAQYRLENPRIIDGISYNPTNTKFLDSADYRALPEERKAEI